MREQLQQFDLEQWKADNADALGDARVARALDVVSVAQAKNEADPVSLNSVYFLRKVAEQSARAAARAQWIADNPEAYAAEQAAIAAARQAAQARTS